MWLLQGTSARLATDWLCAALDLRNPSLGLADLRVSLGGSPAIAIPEAEILQVHIGDQAAAEELLVDGYCRGDDLVASYAPSGRDELTPQICWRLLRGSSEAQGLELVLSVYTTRLDSNATSSFATSLSVDEVLVWNECGGGRFEPLSPGSPSPDSPLLGLNAAAVLFRLPGGHASYLEMVHPSDLCRASVRFEAAPGQRVRSVYQVFAHRLEKGVMRRGRLRGYFMRRGEDEACGRALRAAFLASAPPLTA